MVSTQLEAGPRACVGVVGYYGADSRMQNETYAAMIQECKEIVEKDFQMDLEKCNFVGNGGTWSSHIPVELWKHVGRPTASNVYFVFPAQFDAGERRSAYLEVGKIGPALNKSHAMMYNRLTLSSQHWARRSCAEIGDIVKAGAHTIVANNLNDREQLFLERCTHLIYLPLKEDDEDVMHGARMYNTFNGPKRLLAWADMFP